MAGVYFPNEKETSGSWTDEQRAAVIEEMNFILTHPTFKSSSRCVDLFRYLIQWALTDGENGLKERTLGIEVFGRGVDYDLAADNIARRIASEIRKRLAQYYHEQDIKHRVTIHLLRGSYRLVFEFHTEEPHRAPMIGGEADLLPKPANPQASMTPPLLPDGDWNISLHGRRWVLGAVAAALLCCACFPLISVNAFQSPLYRVWKPLFRSGEVITVYLPIRPNSLSGAVQTGLQAAGKSVSSSQVGSPTWTQFSSPTLLRLGDVYAGNTITSLFSNFKKQSSLRSTTDFKSSDLLQTPAVLIGISITVSDLRYSVHHDPVSKDRWVQDAQNPSRREWFISGKQSQSANALEDYAVITRIFNQETGQWVIALTGLNPKGTKAAAELIADPKYAMLIPASIGDQGNFQIVLQTLVTGGEPGPPQVLAVQTW